MEALVLYAWVMIVQPSDAAPLTGVYFQTEQACEAARRRLRSWYQERSFCTPTK